MNTVHPAETAEKLPQPEGRVFGFFPTRSDLDACVQALRARGVDESQLTILDGESGLRWIETVGKQFFFSDPEDRLLVFARNQLTAGHAALGVPVDNRDDAVAVAEAAKPFGGRDFQYEGIWVAEKLPE